MSAFRGIFGPRRNLEVRTMPTLRSAADPLDPLLWTIQHSPGMPPRPMDPWHFSFPHQDGIHYVTRPHDPITPGRVVRMEFRVDGSGPFVAAREGGDPAVGLFIQRRGDNLSGQGPYEHYRFWNQRRVRLAPGTHVIEAPLHWEEWTGVYGKRDASGFAACVGELDRIGFTFGGKAYGHGVYSQGGAIFHLLDFKVV